MIDKSKYTHAHVYIHAYIRIYVCVHIYIYIFAHLPDKIEIIFIVAFFFVKVAPFSYAALIPTATETGSEVVLQLCRLAEEGNPGARRILGIL